MDESVVKLVKSFYPNAKVDRDGAMFFCHTTVGNKKIDLGAGFSIGAAWGSAAVNCNEQTNEEDYFDDGDLDPAGGRGLQSHE